MLGSKSAFDRSSAQISFLNTTDHQRTIIFLLRTLLSVLLLLTLTRCSGPGAIEESTPESTRLPTAPAGPAINLLFFADDGLIQHNTQTEALTLLIPSSSYLNVKEMSPDGQNIAVAYFAADSSRLMIYNINEGRCTPLHSTPGEVVYSVAWSPHSDALAFGFYEERQLDYSVAMGPGGLMTASADGSNIRSVGCSVSKYAKHWLPSGDLIVGDGNNLYVVNADDCLTLSTNDIRKKHFITYSPDGRRMAYIYRDLVYNRNKRAYEPDSTLYLADFDGTNEKKLFEHRYHARNLAWSPDGTELSFDIQSKDDPSHRYILMYNVETEKTAYFLRPDQYVGVSNVNASWSPSGNNVAFDLIAPGLDTYQKAVQTSLYMMIHVVATLPVGAGFDTTWGWASDGALIFSAPEGLTIYEIESRKTILIPRSHMLVSAWKVDS